MSIDQVVRKKIVVFDTDSTVIESLPVVQPAFIQAMNREMEGQGLTIIDFTKLPIHLWRGGSMDDIIEHVLAANGLDEETQKYYRDGILEAYQADLQDMLASLKDEEASDMVCDGVTNLLQELEKARIPCGIYTGASDPVNANLLDTARLTQYFVVRSTLSGIVYRDDPTQSLQRIVHRKRQDILQTAYHGICNVVNEYIEPSDVLVIGDSLNDCLAANALGMKSLAVATGGTPLEQLESYVRNGLASYAVKDLTDTQHICENILGVKDSLSSASGRHPPQLFR